MNMKNKFVVRKFSILVLVVGLISMLATGAFAAIPAYLWIDGIDGSVDFEGRKDSIEVLAFNHEISRPIDENTGLPSGARRHSAFTIVKQFDKSSPLLYQALITGTPLAFAELKWYRLDPATRMEEHYFTYKLENAIITSIKPWMPNTLDPLNMPYGHMEEVTFAYEKITWTWLPDNIETQDSWETK